MTAMSMSGCRAWQVSVMKKFGVPSCSYMFSATPLFEETYCCVPGMSLRAVYTWWLLCSYVVLPGGPCWPPTRTLMLPESRFFVCISRSHMT